LYGLLRGRERAVPAEMEDQWVLSVGVARSVGGVDDRDLDEATLATDVVLVSDRDRPVDAETVGREHLDRGQHVRRYVRDRGVRVLRLSGVGADLARVSGRDVGLPGERVDRGRLEEGRGVLLSAVVGLVAEPLVEARAHHVGDR